MGRSYTRSVRGMPSVTDAEKRAREMLEPLAERWAHVQAVAARADGLTPAVEGEEEQHLLVVAAWWHDLGYTPARPLRPASCRKTASPPDGSRTASSGVRMAQSATNLATAGGVKNAP